MATAVVTDLVTMLFSAGKASGNHIHIEVAEGCVLRKIPNPKGYYNIVGIMDVRKVLWILDGFTTVVNTKGLNFKHCKSARVEEDEDVIYFVADRAPCRIREKLEFINGKPSGKILGTIPKGGRAELTHFTQRHEGDGYEWFQIRYITPTGAVISGFVQGDLISYKLTKEKK